jgi:hypothetical protein
VNDAAQLYYAAQACLIELEQRGIASEEVTEAIREKMDELWLQMDEAEHAHSRELAEKLLSKPPAGPILP